MRHLHIVLWSVKQFHESLRILCVCTILDTLSSGSSFMCICFYAIVLILFYFIIKFDLFLICDCGSCTCLGNRILLFLSTFLPEQWHPDIVLWSVILFWFWESLRHCVFFLLRIFKRDGRKILEKNQTRSYQEPLSSSAAIFHKYNLPRVSRSVRCSVLRDMVEGRKAETWPPLDKTHKSKCQEWAKKYLRFVNWSDESDSWWTRWTVPVVGSVTGWVETGT